MQPTIKENGGVENGQVVRCHLSWHCALNLKTCHLMPTPPCDTVNPPTWVVHCDGSALPNPGRMGLGVVILAPDGERQTLSQTVPGVGCNNEAELRAVMTALRSLPSACRHVIVYSDNSILVTQLMQAGAKPVARLAALFDEARTLLAGFVTASLKWVPRHRNAEADALARGALGMAPKPPHRVPAAHRHKR